MIGPSGNPGITLNANGTASYAGQITALSFETQSALALKKDVEVFTESALDILSKVQVFQYKYKADPRESTRIGIVADYVPNELISGKEHDHADLANLVGLLLKGLQELAQKVTN